MAYSYLDNMELEQAIKMYLSEIQTCKILGTELVNISEALGRITAEAVFANISSPHYNASAMDGIAVRAAKTFGASDTTPVILVEGTDFVRLDTGDPLPDFCDSVVMIEDVIEMGDGTVKLINAVSPWQNIRQIGEDLCRNDMILPSNTLIEPASIGAIMAGGVIKIKVRKRPVVGIIPTGDEIVAPTDNPQKGEIIEFNSSIFSAILKNWGAAAKVYPIVPDKYELIKRAVEIAVGECDLVLLNAGSSAGREDFSCSVIKDLGKVFVHGIAIKPGKPTILGMVDSRPVIGVPGYPVSGIIVMEKLVKRAIEHMMKVNTCSPVCIQATLSRNIVSSLKYKEFVRVKLGDVGGKVVATPLNRGAAVVTSFLKADGLLEIPRNSEGLMAGKEVKVELQRSIEVIKNTLVLTGSHDPLIDTITDILRKCAPDKYIASSHVGSMGGIMAIKRNEAHMAGIHLLDEQTGKYNTGYVEKYLGKGKAAIIKGVRRQQGLMAAHDNPKQITGISDIANRDKNISYVNRQKGSGTRILLDYMLRQNNLSAEKIYGYEREEYTHMNVAAIIESGSADAGMGIYSSAKAFGLDFIPVCEEQYDFVIPVEYMEHEIVKLLIAIIKGKEFEEALAEMGGYLPDNQIGEINIV